MIITFMVGHLLSFYSTGFSMFKNLVFPLFPLGYRRGGVSYWLLGSLGTADWLWSLICMGLTCYLRLNSVCILSH